MSVRLLALIIICLTSFHFYDKLRTITIIGSSIISHYFLGYKYFPFIRIMFR